MKLYVPFLPVFTFIFLQAAAQGPTLTSANNAFKVGDTFTNQYTKKANGVYFGTPGANQVWDYSNLVDSTAAIDYTAILPSATPYADSFPGSNVAFFSIQQDSAYQYFNATSNLVEAVGAISAGYTTRYIKPQIYIVYPFSYQSFFSDTVIQTIPTTNTTFNGRDTVTADGYGTLLLPGKMYTNVLRVQRIENITTVQKSQGINDTIHIRSIDYLYLTPGTNVPLLSVAQTVITNVLIQSTITAYDVYYLKNFTTLPLKFLSFSAVLNNRQVLLQWQTVHEVNTGYFNVERSTTGTEFTNIGQVQASGNAASAQYSFTDKSYEKTGMQTVYYRLQQKDKDGKVSYSNVSIIHAPATTGKVYPNPATDFINLNIKGAAIADAVSIYDAKGHLLQQWQNFPAARLIDVSHLATGSYYIQVLVKGNTTTSTIIKQ